MEPIIKKNITKYLEGVFSTAEDELAVEKRLRIFVKDKEIISFLCSPSMVNELVVGFAMSEGLFKGKGRLCPEDIVIKERPGTPGLIDNNDIEAHLLIEAEIESLQGAVTSGCAKGITLMSDTEVKEIEDDLKISPDDVFKVFQEFQKRSALYKKTGCVHSAALSDAKKIVAFAEDIGRHNAVDKIIGYCYLNNIDKKGKILLSSGRLSSEIAYKTVRASIPVLVSRTAPTAMAVALAEKNNLTIIGFLRGSRFTIYSHPERVMTP